MSDDGVIVVGAGPVGLVTAYGLARTGVPVTVLEAEEQVIDSPRAMVYHWVRTSCARWCSSCRSPRSAGGRVW